MSFLPTFATAAILIGCAGIAEAQAYVVYAPPVVAPAPVVVYPGAAPTVAYRPVTPYLAPTAVYAPVAVPAPVVVAPVRAVQPVVRTRYRPFLGGTVSRVRYRYAPSVVVAPLY